MDILVIKYTNLSLIEWLKTSPLVQWHLFQCLSIDIRRKRLWSFLLKALITSAKEVMFLPDFVCLSVCLCVSKITQKVMDGSFWNFEGMSGMAQTTSVNFGGDLEGILDSGLLWNFRYHCFQWGIRETAAKPLPPSEQHCLGGGVRALTAF